MPLSSTERMFRALDLEEPDRVPIFFVEQVARYIPEVASQLHKENTLQIARDPKKASELTLTAYRQLKVDAVLPFTHAVLLIEALGLTLRWTIPPFIRNRQSAVTNPIPTRDAAKTLPTPDVENNLDYMLEEIRLLSKAVGEDVPIIASVVAPFTLAAYIQGTGPLKTALETNPDLVRTIQEKTIRFLCEFAEAKIDAGASIAMIWDWAVGYGAEQPLSLSQYTNFVLPYEQQLIHHLKQRNIPTILWIPYTYPLLDGMLASTANVISIGARTDLTEAKRKTNSKIGLYGNLDSELLFDTPEIIAATIKDCMRHAAPGGGYIFSTGNRVKREPLEKILLMIRLAKQYGKYPLKL